MMIERTTFYLKFGKAKEALAAMKEMEKAFAASSGPPVRMLTDVSGDSYRLILEVPFKDFTDMEKQMKEMDMSKMRDTYEKFIPYCERSYKEFLKVV